LGSSLLIDTIGELVLESSPAPLARISTIGEEDEVEDSSVSSWLICTNGGLNILGKRCRVRSDRGELLKSRLGRAFGDATGVAAVIEEGLVFKPWPASLGPALMTREYLLVSISYGSHNDIGLLEALPKCS